MTDRTPLVLGTHHVAVICSDYEGSRRFYVAVLGLEVSAGPPKAHGAAGAPRG